MANAYKGSTYKFKQMEIAYDSLHNVGLYELAESVASIMLEENYVPKLSGNKYKFVYNR
jgi:hypothetical protein